jgi:hypothetical protein
MFLKKNVQNYKPTKDVNNERTMKGLVVYPWREDQLYQNYFFFLLLCSQNIGQLHQYFLLFPLKNENTHFLGHGKMVATLQERSSEEKQNL